MSVKFSKNTRSRSSAAHAATRASSWAAVRAPAWRYSGGPRPGIHPRPRLRRARRLYALAEDVLLHLRLRYEALAEGISGVSVLKKFLEAG